jgi:hypothetical protein
MDFLLITPRVSVSAIAPDMAYLNAAVWSEIRRSVNMLVSRCYAILFLAFKISP